MNKKEITDLIKDVEDDVELILSRETKNGHLKQIVVTNYHYSDKYKVLEVYLKDKELE